jgi:excisionase family DNA binding protein
MNATSSPIGEQQPAAENLLTKEQVAQRLQVTTRTLESYQRKGRVPFLKIGRTVRFSWSDVQRHLRDNCRVGPAA